MSPAETLLPIPPALLEHHLQTLRPLLETWVEKQTVPPVQLITGPRGVGKRAMIHWLSQALLCQRGPFGNATSADDSSPSLFGDTPPPSSAPSPDLVSSLTPCGECMACKRALQNQWLDFTEIQPESDTEKTGTLKIDQFREIKASQGFQAHEGRFRIFFIDQAERMTNAAANSVLKLLEEPPTGWLFFLTTSDPSLLLSTIVSRCQIIRLKPLSREILQTLLRDSPQANTWIDLAQGSWEKAIRLSQDAHIEKREHLARFIAQPQKELTLLVDWAAQQDSHLELLMDQLEFILLDLIEWSLNSKTHTWKNQDLTKTLIQHAQQQVQKSGDLASARRFWLATFERTSESKQQLSAPVNRKLLAQNVLMPWLAREIS